LLINQSAISRQIQILEEEYEVNLFERHARGVRLTPAGELLFCTVREMSFAADRARSEIDALQDLKRGHIKIHSVESMISQVVPNALEKFHKQFPGVNFEVILSSSDAILAAVRQGEADLGVTFASPATPGVRTVYRTACQFRAIMRPDHPLASQRDLSVADLVAWSVGVSPRPTGSRQLFDEACRSRSVEISPKLETNSVELLHRFAFIKNSVVVTSVEVLSPSLRTGRLVAIPLNEVEFHGVNYEILTMVGRKPTVAAERFLLFLGHEFGFRDASGF
jgi:DNA-binding transcriptional LysR family regulator